MAHERFSFTCIQDDTRFVAFFGDGSPTVTDGYGGWQLTDRPKDIALTIWKGRNPIAVEIPFLLDYWPDGSDAPAAPGEECEAMIHNLERMCGLGSSDSPPVLRVQGYGIIPHDYTRSPGLEWVIESVTWERALELRSSYGNRLRAGGTITIRQYKESQTLERLWPKKKSKKKTKRPHGRPRVHFVKAGETLSGIAKRYYGDASKWHVIADANKIRDPRKIKIGDRLRIP